MSTLKISYECPVCHNTILQQWNPFPLDLQMCRVNCVKCHTRLLLEGTLCSTCTKVYRMSCMDLPRVKNMRAWIL